MIEQKLLTIEEASDYLRMPIKTIREKVAFGMIRAYKPGKRILFDLEDLKKFVKRSVINA